MRHALVTIAVLTLTACDFNVDKAFELMTGRKTNVVVLSKESTVLMETPIVLVSNEPMQVLGEWSSLCIVLKDGIALRPQREMDKAFADALGGSKVRVKVVLSDNSRVTLHEPLQGWSKFGRVLPRDELSACASASCGSNLPVGATIKSIELSATPKLEARGIFWQSEEDLERRPKPAQSTADERGVKPQPSCRS